MMYQSVTKERAQKMESWEEINEELGTYMPVAQILRAEGGKTGP